MREIILANAPAYELVKKQEIEELSTCGYLLKHKKTGARVVLMVNEDNNKVFNIGFKTPPADSTGVAHIIEHTVLCGSKKYPAKDPFVELMKGSLNTFLNAMTYSDKTIFPVASCNDKDFKNLMNIYMDAVFYPNIYQREEIFRQEGWSYELEDKDAKLMINGVVYNEMKGSLSTPDSILADEIEQIMFADTCYGYNSGGNPDDIPNLTYEDFLAFHKKYYHPSNSYIYLYGDMDMVERLNWMDEEYLKNFERAEVDADITYQKPFEAPKYVEKEYPLGEEEDENGKTMYSYTTTAGSYADRLDYYGMKVLENALISMPGAPLKKALIDAGVGKDIYGEFSYGTLQNDFSVIAKEAEEGKLQEFVKIVEDTLKKLVKEGIEKDSLKAALNILEFQYREADFGSFPKGLLYCLDSFHSWLYDENEPFLHVQAGKTFEELNQAVDSGYFEGLIQKYLLDNNHKLILTMHPKKGLSEEKTRKTEEWLQAYKESLSEEEIEKMIADTKALKRYQSEPSTEEELKTIPVLKLEDIDRLPRKFHIDERTEENVKVIFSEVASNEIAYLNVGFRIDRLPSEYIPYFELFKEVLANMNTKHYDYIKLSNYINMHSGGFWNTIGQYTQKDGGCILLFQNYIKVFYHEMKTAFEILSNIIRPTKFEDEKRLYEIIAEQKSRLRQGMISSGHIIAMTRGTSYLNESGYIADMTEGVGYYKFLEDLEQNFEKKKGEVLEILSELSELIFTKENMVMSFTADEIGYAEMKKEFAGFVNQLPEKQVTKEKKSIAVQKLNEGLKIPSPVSYVARVGNFKAAGYEYTGVMEVLSNILDNDYLWNLVRVKGGAYGVMSFYSRNSGNVSFISYRDPHVGKTNDAFNSVPEFLRTFKADDREILKYIIGTISTKDRPRNPSAEGKISFHAYMTGLTYEDICKEREEILTLSVEKVRKLAPVLEAVLAQNVICTVGNADKIQENAELFTEIKDLLS